MSDTPSPLSTILAGAPVAVELEGGLKLTVFVRQMPARFLMEKYTVLAITGKEAEILDNVCKNIPGEPPLPEGWVDALTEASHAALVEKAKALNFSRGLAQLERVKRTQEELKPLENNPATPKPPAGSPLPP